MTNNTILNVSRELLADLLGNDHDKRIMAERHLLAMLANAPSPAGVDGLKRYEVFPYLDDEVAEIDICESDDGSFVKYEDAQAIIDGLRGEVGAQRVKTCTALKERNDAREERDSFQRVGIRAMEERDQQAQRIGELASHLEFAVTILTVAGLAGNAQVEAMRSALSAGKEVE